MTARTMRAKQPGQSIPLIALMIVVLIGAVGLSVDVGNTYAQQRNTVRATNAAALAGMNTLIQNGGDGAIGQVIQQSLKSNGVDGTFDDGNGTTTGDGRLIEAYYLDSKANHLGSCIIGSCTTVPAGVNYIQVRVRGTVSTYFARVLQRPTLPVNAQAYAGRCTPIQGVYPIGVQSNLLNSSGFAKPQVEDSRQPSEWSNDYVDANNPGGLTRRRIYLKNPDNSPGNFGFLRWKGASSANSNVEMRKMIGGDGNMDEGFDEVTPWPDDTTQPPDGYPIKPHEPNGGDFAHVSTGVSLSQGPSGVGTELQSHIDNKTVMILPIVKPAIGQGNNAAFQIVGFAKFYIIGMGEQGSNTYFDMVYISNASSIACLSTPAITSNTLGITGAVYLKPRWGQQQGGLPIAYQIVMDTSGSMSYNFNGEAHRGGSGAELQCESYAEGTVQVNAVECAGSDYWRTPSERRIYALKHAMVDAGGFIDNLGLNDKMRILTFTTDSDNGNQVLVNTGPDWSNDKDALKQTVMSAGSYRGDQYRTNGGTPGASALKKAFESMQLSMPTTAPNGQSYLPVIIYLTDGVANIFLNGVLNDQDVQCPSYTRHQTLNTPRCQIDPELNNAPREEGLRPITAMVDQSNKIKRHYDGLNLFVVALGRVNVDGLNSVASDSTLVFPVTRKEDVISILKDIQGRNAQPCIKMEDPDWVSHIDPAHTASFPPGSLTLPEGVYGYLYLTDDRGAAINVPWNGSGTDPRPSQNAILVTQDGLGENLTYSVPTQNGLLPGNYRLNGAMYYKAAAPEGDGISRQYRQMVTGDANRDPLPYLQFTLSPLDALGSSIVIRPIYFDGTNFEVCP